MKQIFILNILLVCSFHLLAQTYGITTTVYTPKNTAVEAKILTSGELSEATKAAWKSQTLAEFPNATFLADATNTYNCHAYAWHLSEGQSNIVWINAIDGSLNQNVSKYWTDGSFIQVCDESDADKVHYYAGDHSATASTAVSGKYESKWGPNIRIRHDLTEVPNAYSGDFRRYYASTKVSGEKSILCAGNRTFSVKNITGATYTWTYSNNLSGVGATNTNQLTVQRNGSSNGTAWVQVAISTPCSGTSIASLVNFTVGAPDMYSLTGTYTTEGYSNWLEDCNILSTYTFPGIYSGNVDVNDPVATSYTWTLVSKYPSTAIVGISPNPDWQHVTVTVKPQGASATYNLTTENTCGLYSHDYTFVADGTCFLRPGGGGKNAAPNLLIAPNPVIGSFTVSLEKANKTAAIKEIIIKNKFGMVLKRLKFDNSSRSQLVNIQSLPTDVYLVQVFDGQKWMSEKMIKQ